ncbi:C6 zinc finger domain protein [Lasiosphaeria hispida]|uniref:C6 zinc finger domain protein n=1 Tax=Lasiosphaeria hispida TaxID=260671 RepID=A0AAJ0MDJ3_9PEZI|nr:C6 zinc finger domain protein [Lasiosphaeria hispida]
MATPKTRRVWKAKVKSGCGTCKSRKVKCDEGRPICRRCSLTGRFCEGYGIWGGGNTSSTPKCPLTAGSDDLQIISRTLASIPLLASSVEENGYFEWFRSRAARKLPGTFFSDFWRTLLVQATVQEPAVLHAVLALSAAHKRGPAEAHLTEKSGTVMDSQERFMLQQYVKAIGYLQPHFSAKDRASSRVALITCFVFICLDFLRSHFESAQVHLQNGLRILGETHLLSDKDEEVFYLKPDLEAADIWTVEAFSRLHLQVELLQHMHPHPCFILQPSPRDSPPPDFHTFNEAWQSLHRLFNEIFHLTHLSRRQPPSHLPHRQHQIQTALAHWLTTFQTRLPAPEPPIPTSKHRFHTLLLAYHTLATLLALTSLDPDNETLPDRHTPHFTHLLAQLTHLWSLSASDPSSGLLARRGIAGPLRDGVGVVDMGWLPLLFHVAVRCRVHRLRRQALGLMGAAVHREGIWDSGIVEAVAGKVVEVEEGGFYEGEGDGAVLPEERRLSGVEVVLLGAPVGVVVVFCRRRGVGRVVLARYDVCRKVWVDNHF